MQNQKLTEADGLSMDIVKHVITTIMKPLTHVCNTSFKTWVFPDKLKIAKLIPKFKKTEQTIDQFYYCHNFLKY